MAGLVEGVFTYELALPGYRRARFETRVVAGKLRRESRALAKLDRQWVAGHVEVTNEKDGSVLVGVPDARFEMGSTAGGQDERPVHGVHLSPYFIGKTEVTWSQYRRFCKETGHPPPPEPAWKHDDRHPVVNVSWSDAQANCESRLSPDERLLGFHAVFERPTVLLPLALSYTAASASAGLCSGLYLLAIPTLVGPLAFARFWTVCPAVLVTAVLGRQLCLDPFVWALSAVPLPVLEQYMNAFIAREAATSTRQ